MTDETQLPPRTYQEFSERYPALLDGHTEAARQLLGAGPLGTRDAALVRLGVCVGAGLESAVRSHVRRALEAGIDPREIEHAVLLGMNSIGFPRTVAAWQWACRELPGPSAEQ